jgi:hypothetical protein
VRDLDVHGDDVVIATHGRAFWVMDDVTPLRQARAGAASSSVSLLAPATAVRVRPAGFTGTPLPKDEAMAANPPLGAYIDYVLASAPAGPVVVSILDAQGALVRRYSSDERRPAADLAKIRTAPEWVTPLVPPSTTPGMHRLVWPLRYPAPAVLAEGNPDADGVWAPPGSYTVELSVGSERVRQPLTVAPDPRVSLAPDAYARQFALARRIETVSARVAAAVTAGEAAHKRLALAAAAEDASVQSLLGPEPGGPAIPAPAGGLTPLRALASHLGRLLEAVDGADAAPSPDAEAGVAKIEPAVEATLAAWTALQGRLPSAP